MQTTYNELIGYNSDGNAVILRYTYDRGSRFRGAVGAILELVSQEEYDERTSDEALKGYAEELWREDASQPNGTTDSLEDWTEDAREDLIEMMFDDSYSYLVPEGEHVTTNCIGAGRIFPSALDDIATWIRPELADVIRDAEPGGMKHDLTDLVGDADIADRCGVGRPAVSNWIKRYSDFPAPLLTISSGTRIWSWVEVQEWITNQKEETQKMTTIKIGLPAKVLAEGEN